MSTYSYSNTTMSLAEIIANKNTKKQSVENKQLISSLPPFHPFKPLPSTDANVIKLAKPEAIRQGFGNIYGFKALSTIPSLTPGVEVPDNIKNDSVLNFMTSSWTYAKVDGLAVAEQDNPKLNKKLMLSAREYIRNHYFGNGTIQGLYHRMNTQITKHVTSKVTQEEYEYVLDVLPFYGLSSLSGDGATIVGISPEMNYDAAAGAPVFKTGVTFQDRIEDIVVRATQYLLILSSKGANGLLLYFTNPSDPKMHEMVTILCPKADIYNRKEYYSKCRPFGVIPGALRVLFACLTHAIKPNIQNFIDNPKSISAVGLTWAHGGVRRYYDFITGHKQPGYYPISWGDDQSITVVASDGSSILITPDVSGMDMKIDKNKFDLFKAWMLSAFTTKKIDYSQIESLKHLRSKVSRDNLNMGWFYTLMFMIHYLQHTPVLVYKQYVFEKSKGLMSGVNATTWIDTVASASINYHLSKVDIPVTFNLNTIAEYVDKIFKKASSIGFPFKKDGPVVQILTKTGGAKVTPNIIDETGKCKALQSTELIGLPFLGQKISTFTFPGTETDNGEPMTIIIPTSDPVTIIANCALKTNREEKDVYKRDSLAMQGIVGRGFNAVGSLDCYLYLKSLYEKYQSNNRRIIYDKLSTDDIGFENLPLEEACNTYDYPSIFWYAKVYATEQEKTNLTKVTLITSKEVSEASISLHKLTQIDDDLEESLEDHTYSSKAQYALEMLHDDLDENEEAKVSTTIISKLPLLPTATKAQATLIQKSPVVAKLHELRYKERLEKKKLLKQHYKSIVSKAGRRLQTITDVDEETDMFDDIQDEDLEDEIEKYRKEHEEVEKFLEDEEYRKFLKQMIEENYFKEDEIEHLDEQHELDQELTEEERYFDPFDKQESIPTLYKQLK